MPGTLGEDDAASCLARPIRLCPADAGHGLIAADSYIDQQLFGDVGMRALTGLILVLQLAAAQAVGTFAAQAQEASEQNMIDSLLPIPNLLGPSRGIRAANQNAEPATSLADDKAPFIDGSHSPSVNLHVEFVTGSAELTRAAARTLDRLGRVLTNDRLRIYRFRIEGHTDTVGDRDGNRLLSERRAVRVTDYLVRRYHVEPARLVPVGVGEEGLLVPTPDQTAEVRNRRVQVLNLGT